MRVGRLARDFLESFSVGATNSNDQIADFSSRGPSTFGKVNPDVRARRERDLERSGGDYAFSGTSMAAPHTAGTLALVLSAELALVGDVSASTDAVRSTALNIADDSCGGDEDGDPNNAFGDGRIDAAAAVALVATGGTLAGDVTDVIETDPIAGAAIEASSGARTFTATTDAAGHFELFLGCGHLHGVGIRVRLPVRVRRGRDRNGSHHHAGLLPGPLPQRDITGTVTAEEDGSDRGPRSAPWERPSPRR